MRIEDRFTVALPVEEAWEVLLDLERIAPCMPGAELREVEGDVHRGVVKVKLGAITAQFAGEARFAEVDEAARRVVLSAQGKEVRGQGNAAATVTASLRDAGEGKTEVSIDTDLKITGRLAQFGRGVMADVSSKLLGEFARCLERDLLGGGRDETVVSAAPETPAPDMPAAVAPAAGVPGAPSDSGPAGVPGSPASMAAPSPGPASQPRAVSGRSADPVDLLAVAGPSVAARVAPAALGGVLLLLVVTKSARVRALLAAVAAALVAAARTASAARD